MNEPTKLPLIDAPHQSISTAPTTTFVEHISHYDINANNNRKPVSMNTNQHRTAYGRQSLSIFYQNVRGLGTKSKEFHLASISCNHNIIALTETWLKDSHYNEEYFGPNFIVYRCDRSPKTSAKASGGGVLIAVSTRIKSERILNMENSNEDIEFVCVKCSFEFCDIYIYNLYTPPDSSIHVFQRHVDVIKSIEYEANDVLLVMGDFNFSRVEWTQNGDKNDFMATIIFQLPVMVRAALNSYWISCSAKICDN